MSQAIKWKVVMLQKNHFVKVRFLMAASASYVCSGGHVFAIGQSGLLY